MIGKIKAFFEFEIFGIQDFGGLENWWLDLSVGFFILFIYLFIFFWGGGGKSKQSGVPASIQFLLFTVCRYLSYAVISKARQFSMEFLGA